MPVLHAPPPPTGRDARRAAARRRDRRRRTGRRALVVALVTTLVIALVSGTTATVRHLRDRDLVATVGTERVGPDEFTFHVDRVAPSVEPDDTAAVARAALDEIAHDTVVLELARRHDLTDITDFASVQRALEQENERRARALASGEVVYGLTSFDLPSFYSRTLEGLTSELQRTLSRSPGDPLWIDDAQIAAAYDADPERWWANVATSDYTEVRVPAATAAGPSCATALVAAGSDLESLTRPGSACAGAALATGSAPPPTGTGAGGAGGAPTDALAALTVGQVTPAQTDGTSVVVLRLDGRRADRRLALTTYSSRIRQSLVEQGFDAYVDARRPTPTIHLRLDRLTSLTTGRTDQ